MDGELIRRHPVGQGDAGMTQTADATVVVRDVTDAEVAFYRENGWVKLAGLIPSHVADQMLSIVKDQILEAPEGADRTNRVYDIAPWRDIHYIGRDEKVEPFHSLNLSPVIGRNAARFIGRNVPVGFHADLMAVKMPDGHTASKPTGFHQDFPNFPMDRAGMLTFWVALSDMPPERGVMRFYSGSQKEGSLGRIGFAGVGLDEYYPHLGERYELSEPFSLKAGDCTVHNGMVVHGAPGNTTDQPRWSYVMSYFPGDALYTGGPHHIFNAESGCELNQPLSGAKFTIVHP